MQINNPAIFNDFKVYVLTSKSKEALALAGKLNQFAIPPGGGYEHMMMAAAITASIQLECRKRGLRFIDQEEILRDAPDSTKKLKRPLGIPCSIERIRTKASGISETQRSSRPCEPDNIFGIEYGPKQRRYFALEADRGTESLVRHNVDDNSIQRKLLCYRYILKNSMFKKHFDLNKLYPLFITTADTRVDNMIKQAKEDCPEYLDLILFNAVDGFLVYQKTPPLLPRLLGPCRRAKEPLDISRA